MPDSVKAYILLIITTIGWSANSVVGKYAVGHISPLALTFFRLCLALCVILAISIPQIRADWPLLKKNWLLLLGYGVFGFAAFNAFLYSGLNHTSAINGVIEQAGIPGLIFIGNYLLFRTRISPAQILGYAVTLSGVFLTAANGSLDTLLGLKFNIGDLMLMGACVVYAIYTVGLRWKPPVHWKSLMAATAFGGVLACLPLLGWEVATDSFIAPDMVGFMTIAFTGLVPSLVSQILYIRGIELIGPNRAGLFINTVPVFGTLLSVAFLSEPFHTYHLVALIMVLGGIAIAERGKA
ncbi:DMT family transporter [Rhizobium alvei]|uniref:DMT family transporter n=1 Tax=Rhizobium alvei TaxID=1132659 RepID=A0ABT8YLH3_9HYPH|nr:DMT family transporter [Rhizobium alvei]MDO6964454.1 DMT family transporter [Rhizobium alvei]